MDKVGKVDQLYETIKHRIIHVEYMPGEVLNESLLAGEFGVSRTPVREALRRLQQEKWISSLPKIGMQVIVFDINQLKDLFNAKEALETMVIKLAIDNADEKDILHLKKILNAMEKIDFDDMKEVMRHDDIWHHAIWDIADNEIINVYIEDLQYRLFRGWVYTGRRMKKNTNYRELFEIFQKTVGAIETRDKEQAEKIVKQHVEFHRADMWQGLL
jgi:DNA-binding GntR family transcriptional regulator